LKHFTEHRLLSIPLFLEVMSEQVIPFYCTNHREFIMYRNPDASCKRSAQSLPPSSFIRSKVNDMLVTYTGKSTNQINFEFNSCTCRWYLAYAICSHVVAACKLYGRQLNGCMASRNYIYRSKRGPKPKANPVGQFLLSVPVQSEKRTADDENQEIQSAKKPRTSNSINDELIVAEPVKKTRGRPRLTSAQKAARESAKEAAKEMIDEVN
jgi:hypothetical protein